MKNHNSLCVGIDLGTTNSAVATCRVDNGKLHTPVRKVARAVDARGSKRNSELLPSCVWYSRSADGEYVPIVGDAARESYRSVPFLVAKSVKSQMGKQTLTGLQDDIPDKTPEEVSARIIRHLLADVEHHYDEKITDVVITVPASFDPAQRLATLRAAELAGVDVHNEDGSYDQDILLSEPEAVMYSVLNQIRSGEYDANLSFDTEKKVLVFDIGGGTLDITLHAVRRNAENPEILDMDLIATNRFTPVAGDTFDARVAEEMFRQYCDYYRREMPGAVSGILEKKDVLMPALQAFAETLKVDINSRYEDALFRGRTLSDEAEFDIGGTMPNGYAYDGLFTKRDYEVCVEDLLGKQYTYDDYRTIEGKAQTGDIIWPVLDVLRKGAKKLGQDELRVDAVILSGGMSRLYLVKQRLEEFFGFHVISAPDPDLAVAQGAVVYHYHQHQDSELMKRIHAKEHTALAAAVNDRPAARVPAEPQPELFIRSGKRVLADSLYLGLRNGAYALLAEEGQELPFRSQELNGFRVEAGQNIVRVPIQKQGSHPGERVTIASGDICFRTRPGEDMPVCIRFDLSRHQLITIEAWMCADEAGAVKLEKGEVTLSLGDTDKVGKGCGKFAPPSGSVLNPVNELNALVLLCKRPTTPPKMLKARKQTIAACGNPEAFAAPLLKVLESEQSNQRVCFHLLPLSRKLAAYWTEEEKARLTKLCWRVLEPETTGYTLRGSNWRSVYGEAILTMGALGTDADVEKLYTPRLCTNPAYRDKLMQAFAAHGLHGDWVADCLRQNVPVAYRWVGPALSRSKAPVDRELVADVAELLLNGLERGWENRNVVTDAVISLGFLCDMRSTCHADEPLRQAAEQAILGLEQRYPEDILRSSRKAQSVALKMLRGVALDEDDEQFLLGLFAA